MKNYTFAAIFITIIMLTPFIFGKIPTDLEFTNREVETTHLIENLTNNINVMLISPRRWGKTSLIHKVSRIITEKYNEIRVCHIDLFNIRSEEEFYQKLAGAVINATSTLLEEKINNAKDFLSKLIPKISFSPDINNEISFSLQWDQHEKSSDIILDLAERIAESKNIKIVICIDEFQNLMYFENPTAFQKKLRAVWQHQKNVSYCLYGSKKHILLDFFSKTNMPFYKFGNLMFLEKISQKHLVSFIIKRFNDTGKQISDEVASKICQIGQNHPYYVQQLAQISWLRTTEKCSFEIVNQAAETLINQLSLLFSELYDTLTQTQINFLKALIANETEFTSIQTITKYNLGSASNVAQIKKALVKKDILEISGKKIEFLDPIFYLWFLEIIRV